MPTGTFLTSLLSKTSLEMWRALLAGRKSRRMPTQAVRSKTWEAQVAR
jgi:hypothetical protein